MELRILSAPDEDVTRIALEGRLDLQGAGEIEQAFTEATATERKAVVVDLGEVSFLASMGMRLLVRVAKALRQSDRCLVLLRPRENVKQALEVAGLVEVLPIADNEATALALARGA